MERTVAICKAALAEIGVDTYVNELGALCVDNPDKVTPAQVLRAAQIAYGEPDLTLEELMERLKAAYPMTVGQYNAWLARHGYEVQ